MMPKQKNAQLQAVLTVSELTAQIKDCLEGQFQQVSVVGEVSNAKVYTSGHWYFSLKDQDATLPCVCFRSTNSLLKFKLEDGLMVVARGRLTLYPPKGGYQLSVTSLEPVGIGEWQLAFEQLRSKLEQEGLLLPERKKRIPMLPRRIGIVTSPVGAAVRDVISALSRRNRNVHIVVAPARVQGDGAAEEVARAIDYLHRIPDIDVIIVARGGGSIEDLWTFNTEVVARAVATSAIPIISGVGHETDVTICDLVADLRAPTPTAAAELVARGSAELIERFQMLQKQLIARVETNLLRARRQLERLKPLQVLLRYSERLKRDRQRVAHLRERCTRSASHSLEKSRRRLEQAQEKLQALGPQNVLNRGYAIMKTIDGEIIRDASQVTLGDSLIAILSHGELAVRVENIALKQENTQVDPGLIAETTSELGKTLTDDSEQQSPSPDRLLVQQSQQNETGDAAAPAAGAASAQSATTALQATAASATNQTHVGDSQPSDQKRQAALRTNKKIGEKGVTQLSITGLIEQTTDAGDSEEEERRKLTAKE